MYLARAKRIYVNYQFIFHALIDCLPNHGEAGDGGDVLQNDAGTFRNVIMHPDKRSEEILSSKN